MTVTLIIFILLNKGWYFLDHPWHNHFCICSWFSVCKQSYSDSINNFREKCSLDPNARVEMTRILSPAHQGQLFPSRGQSVAQVIKMGEKLGRKGGKKSLPVKVRRSRKIPHLPPNPPLPPKPPLPPNPPLHPYPPNHGFASSAHQMILRNLTNRMILMNLRKLLGEWLKGTLSLQKNICEAFWNPWVMKNE